MSARGVDAEATRTYVLNCWRQAEDAVWVRKLMGRIIVYTYILICRWIGAGDVGPFLEPRLFEDNK